MGKIGIVGTAAAIADAIYDATGKRLRDLPITIDPITIDPITIDPITIDPITIDKVLA